MSLNMTPIYKQTKSSRTNGLQSSNSYAIKLFNSSLPLVLYLLQADERAVLRHFKWPEKKADAMREAAVEYRSLKLLENEVSSYKDDSDIPCGVALKKMAGLLDKYVPIKRDFCLMFACIYF